MGTVLNTIEGYKPGSIEFTKNKRLKEINKSIPEDATVDFSVGDINKNKLVDPGDFFTVTIGDKKTTYYSVKEGDIPETLYKKFNISEQDLDYLKKDKNQYPILPLNGFIHWTRTVKKNDTEIPSVKTPLKQISATNTTVEKKDIEQTNLFKYFRKFKNLHLQSFITSLTANEKNLKKDLNISDEEFMHFVEFALAIAEAETNSGTDKKISPNIRIPLKKIASEIAGEPYEHPSLGMTNIKMSTIECYQHLFKKYGITYDNKTGASNIHEDDYKAAIATIMVLSKCVEDYKNKYEKSYEKQYGADTSRKVTSDEYICVRQKGMRILKDKNSEITKNANSNVDAILDFRKNPNKKLKDDAAMRILQIFNLYNQYNKRNVN